jgi:hypothetical protein
MKDSDFKWRNELWAHILGKDGMKLSLHLDQRSKKISISGAYPRNKGNIYPHNGRVESIGVSSEEQLDKIAADIKRRFLTQYMESYAVGKKQLDDWLDHVKKTDEFVVRLCKFVRQEVHRDTHSKEVHRHYYINRYDQNVTMEVQGPDEVKLEFTVGETKARLIFELLGLKA